MSSAVATSPSAWLARLLRRWDVLEGVALETSPEDIPAVWEYGELCSSRNSRFLAMTIAAFNLIFWPSDLYNLRGQPRVIQELGTGRIVISALCFTLFLALTFIRPMRRHPKGVLTVVGSAGCFAVGYFFGRLGGPSSPWFHFTYLIMMMPLVCWLTVPERVGGTLLFGLSTCVGYFLVFPDYLQDAMAAVSISHMGFAVVLSIGAGWMLDYMRRQAFLMRQALARQASELRSLNGHLDARVQEQTGELRFLASRLESAREAERATIARELHDELGQELTALRYALQATTKHFDSEPTGIRSNLAQLESLLARTTVTARNILVELRPRVLDELGLPAAVEWLVERMSERHGIPCSLELPSSPLNIGEDVSVTAFRIVQESLTNIARHAKATEVWVSVQELNGRLQIVVRDNGQGLSPRSMGQAPRGMGLLGMRERVHALDGELRIESDAGQGTSIRVMLPLMQRTAEVA